MVLLFFYIQNSKENQFLIHKCENEEAELYGDFLNFPESHMDIWDKYYKKQYKVDFDYYPRGRVVYNIKEDIGEQHDLSDSRPRLVNKLSSLLGRKLRAMKAQRPSFKSTGEPCPWPDEV